ncbi:MAG TPA: hypothetical protein VLJ88_08080 [Propionibacteriaceae bacterium]|nr:hypothetical protein [Propionibacteriaceae bacterium]
MVDQESRAYRARRAFSEPDPDPSGAKTPTPAGPTGPPVPPQPLVDDETPKPLYRDEVTPPGDGSGRPAGYTPRPELEDTATRSINFAPRRPPRADDEATTVLPRTRASGRTRSRFDEIDDFETEGRRGLGQRTKLALLIGAVAAVVVIGLAIGYAVLGIGADPTTAPSASASVDPNSPPPTDPSATATEPAGVLLTDASMLSAAQAAKLDADRNWTIELTQRGASDDAPVAACFGGDAVEGQPVPQQKILQVLSSNGKQPLNALHEATAYNTPEEAVQAFAVASRTLGGCATPGAYIAGGRVIRGLGDQSTGVMVKVVDGNKTASHTVVLSRTGRVLNVVDVNSPGRAVEAGVVADTVAAVVTGQCTASGGTCGGTVSVKSGPPPLGGDEPGFLATGDLPPVGGATSPWTAAPIELPEEDFAGSGCETVNWATVPAEVRSARVYLLTDSGKSYFGLNEIVLTMENPKAADALVAKIKKDLESCKDRKLTATVSKPARVDGVGARNAQVTGYTSTVEQKAGEATSKFRVGIVSTGTKVAYTFCNSSGDFDFTNGQWDTVAVRAGERVTQVT